MTASAGTGAEEREGPEATPGGWQRVPRSELGRGGFLAPQNTAEPACRFFALVDLAGLCRFTKGDGLRVGEVQVSQSFLADRWRWDRSKVRRFLDALVRAGYVEIRESADATAPNIVAWIRPGWGFEAEGGPTRVIDQGSDQGNSLRDKGSSAGPDQGSDQGQRPQEKNAVREEGKRTATKQGPMKTPSVDEIVGAIQGGPRSLLKALELQGFSPPDAAWIVRGTRNAEIAVPTATTEELVATALRDLVRKGRTFTRRRFVTFLESAMEVSVNWDLGRIGSPGAVLEAFPLDPRETR